MKKAQRNRLIGLLVLGVAILLLPTGIFHASPAVLDANMSTTTGLVKKGSATYYYKNGKKITNTLKTVTSSSGKKNIYYFGSNGKAITDTLKTVTSSSGKKNRYYFGSNGKAYTNKWKKRTSGGTTYYYYFGSNGKAIAGSVVNDVEKPLVKKIKGVKYAFDSKGRALTGVQVIDEKFYVFNSRGKLNTTRTNKLRKASKYEANAATLKKLLKSYGAKYKKTIWYGDSCYDSGEDGEWVYSGFTVYIFKYDSNGKKIVYGVDRT